jgi:hypothetical protein
VAIDIFIHDSDHSQEHQRFEYGAVQQVVAPGGLVYSDQDYPHERAVEELAERTGGLHRRFEAKSGEPPGYAGGVRLPPY